MLQSKTEMVYHLFLTMLQAKFKENTMHLNTVEQLQASDLTSILLNSGIVVTDDGRVCLGRLD